VTITRLPLPGAVTHGRVIGILRNYDYGEALTRIDTLYEAGVQCLEVAMGHPDAAQTIETARHRHPQLTLGAGTITNEVALRRAINAGAQFLLAPNIDPALIAMSAEQGIPFIAGGHSATECVNGIRAGASAIKIFPASTGGVAHIEALLQPLPDIPLIPTGGVNPDNARDYLRAGAVAVGVGSSLTTLDGAALVAAIRSIHSITHLDGAQS